MQWHVITGSKGGVGKTLLTLLLLGHHLERKADEGVLVLDLNSMNPDISQILLYRKRIGEPITLILEKSKRQITFQKTFSLDRYKKEPFYFGVGWTTNPFMLYDYNHFADLIVSIKEKAEEIAERLQIPQIRSVFIDTNYHFCHLFPERDELYKEYDERGIMEDTMTVWFLWVYRELYELIQERYTNRSSIMNSTAGAIERLFKKRGVGSIVHTYNPVLLSVARPEEPNSLLKLLKRAIMGYPEEYKTIAILANLERLPVGNPVSFKEWMQALHEAHLVLSEQRYYPLFVDVLDQATRRLAEDDGHPIRPLNIFPLSIFQGALEGYTDRERGDAVARLRDFKIYANFSRLLDCKYESFLL